MILPGWEIDVDYGCIDRWFSFDRQNLFVLKWLFKPFHAGGNDFSGYKILNSYSTVSGNNTGSVMWESF